MLTLAIHTAGGACDVALLDGDALLSRQTEMMRRGHDRKLPLLTEALFETTSPALHDLKRIAVCVGPGSFTGIRVGVAFSRGLALAIGKEAEGVTSLEAMFDLEALTPQIAFLLARRKAPDRSFWVQGRDISGFEDPCEIGEGELKARIPKDATFRAELGDKDALEEILSSSVQIAQSNAHSVGIAAINARSPARPASPVYVREPDAALPTKGKFPTPQAS